MEVLPSHRWMTLGQIKRLMRYDNLVNMDTRTVISCVPISLLAGDSREDLSGLFNDQHFYRSIFSCGEKYRLPEVFGYLNDIKMFCAPPPKLVPLYSLKDWKLLDDGIYCEKPYPFKVIFCDISIEGREVRHWAQPLFEALGSALFGLVCVESKGGLEFLVRAAPEVGCFDSVELGPTAQNEAVGEQKPDDDVSRFFKERLKDGRGVVFDHLLSEEGGRFYHEQNRNVLLRVKKDELPSLPEGYFLLDFKTLNGLGQINNILNIQLRNLLSLLEV